MRGEDVMLEGEGGTKMGGVGGGRGQRSDGEEKGVLTSITFHKTQLKMYLLIHFGCAF